VSHRFVCMNPGDVFVPLRYAYDSSSTSSVAWRVDAAGICIARVDHGDSADRPGTYVSASAGLIHMGHTAFRPENLRKAPL